MSCDLVSRTFYSVRHQLHVFRSIVPRYVARPAQPLYFPWSSSHGAPCLGCRSLSTSSTDSGGNPSTTKPLAFRETIKKWEEPFVSEVYRQLRGQHIESKSVETSSSEGAGIPISCGPPAWNFSLEDERGLRFGSAYMLLTLAWNRKFTRLRDLLVNANRTREGAKQALTRVVEAIISATAPPRALSSEGNAGRSAEAAAQHGGESVDVAVGGSGDESSNPLSDALAREAFAEAVEGCLGSQLQQLLLQQVAFLERKRLHVVATVKPQRAAVDAVYGIVGCTRGSSGLSPTTLLQHSSLHVLTRRSTSSSSSLASPPQLYMPEPRSFEFEAALAEAENAAAQRHGVDKAKVDGSSAVAGKDTSTSHDQDSEEIKAESLEVRNLQLLREERWRAEATRAIAETLKQPTTFRQFLKMCGDCGGVLDRGFVVIVDMKLLCLQKLAIVDESEKIICGSFDEEHAVHTLRLELNARFDPSQTNIFFPAFQPSYWQLTDWNYGVGPNYPIDPREISNVSLLTGDKDAPRDAVACFV